MTRPESEANDPVEAHAAAKARIPSGITHSVAHATFHLQRTYGASRARVWKALTDPAAKAQWFGAASERVEIIERGMDVRPGGRERLKGHWGGGVVSTFDATYYDVIENERLVYCYEMHLDDRKISIEPRAAPPRIALQNPSYARPSARTSTAERECAVAPPSGPVPTGRLAKPMCAVRARVRRESQQSGARLAASGASGSAPDPAPPSFASDPTLCHAWAARAVRQRDGLWRGRWLSPVSPTALHAYPRECHPSPRERIRQLGWTATFLPVCRASRGAKSHFLAYVDLRVDILCGEHSSCRNGAYWPRSSA